MPSILASGFLFSCEHDISRTVQWNFFKYGQGWSGQRWKFEASVIFWNKFVVITQEFLILSLIMSKIQHDWFTHDILLNIQRVKSQIHSDIIFYKTTVRYIIVSCATKLKIAAVSSNCSNLSHKLSTQASVCRYQASLKWYSTYNKALY